MRIFKRTNRWLKEQMEMIFWITLIVQPNKNGNGISFAKKTLFRKFGLSLQICLLYMLFL